MHRRSWIEPHHHLLVASGPLQNFVEVETDFSDLEDKILALIKNPEKAERIAKNSVELFRDRYNTGSSSLLLEKINTGLVGSELRTSNMGPR